MTTTEYLERLLQGWRRFGTMLFRPACPTCTACRSVRVQVDQFRPDRSQRRTRRSNEGVVTVRIGQPSVTQAKLQLCDLYHAYQADAKGWPQHPAKEAESYAESFVHHPFPIEEWCYYLDGRLVGVGYVDYLPSAADSGEPGSESNQGGLSAIYFFYDPRQRQRSLGTWNVLCLIEEAARRRLPYVYLGYYVEGCPSMSYKPRFVPNQMRGPDGTWRAFRL
jgi:arginine-tRNA-protein transferase